MDQPRCIGIKDKVLQLIDLQKKGLAGSFKRRIDEGGKGGEDPQSANKRPLSEFSVAHRLGFQCTHVRNLN